MLKVMVPIGMMIFIKSKNSKMMIPLAVIMFNINLQAAETSKISMMMQGDFMSFWIMNMSMWIISLILMIKMNNNNKFVKMMYSLLLILGMTFYTWNFMIFFIFFEISMIMIILTVMSWGYQPERVEATMFMIVMTAMFSLPFFVSLMNNFNHLNFWFLNIEFSIWDYLSFMLIFMVKMPVFFIHMWLPKVHVESPVHGSMILAAIMLKLGCYGMIRMSKMTLKINLSLNFWIVAFGLMGMVGLSLTCAIQPDLKSMIAYSSIVHMMLTLITINLMKTKSIMASLIVMLGHGACSSAMFFMCNQMYKTSKSRSVILNGGAAAMTAPYLTLWFLICMMNAPMPPSINMLSEILAFKIMTSWSKLCLIPISAVMIFSAFYSIILFCIPAHGKSSSTKKIVMAPNSKVTLIMNMHVIPTLLMITKSNIMNMN